MEKITYPIPVIRDSDVRCFRGEDGKVLLKVFPMDDCLFPTHQTEKGVIPDPRTHVPAIKYMEIYDDDVLLCAYPKSGTHWVWEITNMILKREAEYEPNLKLWNMLEFNLLEELASLKRPRVLNTHLPVSRLPNQVFTRKCKILFIQRNPKDIAVSYFHHLKQLVKELEGRWDDFLRLFREGQSLFAPWIDYIQGYEKLTLENNNSNILLLYFEDLKNTPVDNIKKIANFLNVNIDESLARKIAEKCSFQNLKNAQNNKECNDKGGPSVIHRKGEIGDWKNWFTVAQNEMFDDMLEKKMKHSSFTFTYT